MRSLLLPLTLLVAASAKAGFEYETSEFLRSEDGHGFVSRKTVNHLRISAGPWGWARSLNRRMINGDIVSSETRSDGRFTLTRADRSGGQIWISVVDPIDACGRYLLTGYLDPAVKPVREGGDNRLQTTYRFPIRATEPNLIKRLVLTWRDTDHRALALAEEKVQGKGGWITQGRWRVRKPDPSGKALFGEAIYEYTRPNIPVTVYRVIGPFADPARPAGVFDGIKPGTQIVDTTLGPEGTVNYSWQGRREDPTTLLQKRQKVELAADDAEAAKRDPTKPVALVAIGLLFAVALLSRLRRAPGSA